MNLNKTCPKDEFSLLNIEILVDATVENSMFSLMAGFSDYSQIMHPQDLFQESNGKLL